MVFTTMSISKIIKNVCFTYVAPQHGWPFDPSAASLLPQHCRAIDDATAQVPS